MRLLPRVALVAAVASVAAVPLVRAEGELDKQYLSRRNEVDAKVATGLLGLAKTFVRKGAGERARTLAKSVRFFGSPAQIRDAQDVLDEVDDKPTSGAADEVEAKLDEALARYRRGYEDVAAYCEKRALSAEGADVKERLARLVACSKNPAAVASGPAAPGASVSPADGKKDEKAGEGPAAAQKAILDRVNEYRKQTGLALVTLDDDLSKGCQLHCNYLVVNDGKPELEGLRAHEEVSSLPAYTEAGARAGKASDIAWGDGPAGSVDAWMDSLYHRIPILRPELSKIGAGYQTGTHFGRVCVLDLLTGCGQSEAKLVVYPPDKSTGVGLRFGSEMPDPVPSTQKGPAGYPITCTGYGQGELTSCEATLETGGKKVDCYLSSPGNPATSFPQQNTICLIPKTPLATNTVYTAKFHFTCDGQRLEATTTFTTGVN